MQTLQTLERSLLVLELISQYPNKLTIAQTSELSKLNRTIVHRIIKTLEQQGYVKHNFDKKLSIGSKIIQLYDTIESQLPHNSQKVLNQLAIDTKASTALVMEENQECVVVKTGISPDTALQISYRIGTRHTLDQAAAGIALASTLLNHNDHQNPLIHAAKKNGYAYTQNALQHGAAGLFVPIPHRHLALGIVTMDEINLEKTLPILIQAAASIS